MEEKKIDFTDPETQEIISKHADRFTPNDAKESASTVVKILAEIQQKIEANLQMTTVIAEQQATSGDGTTVNNITINNEAPPESEFNKQPNHDS